MDSGGGYTRNNPFHLILSPPKGDDGLPIFRINYQAPIILNPNVEWEAAIVDAYIPLSKSSSSSQKKHEWFSYICKLDIPGPVEKIYRAYPRWYYEPDDEETPVHSFIKKFNEVQNRKDLYGEFTNQTCPPKLKIYVEDEYMCIKVVKRMDFPKELIIIKMDKPQYSRFFGKISQFETYYKGRLVEVKEGETPACIYDEKDGEIKILSSTTTPYVPTRESGFNPTYTDLEGCIFKSTEKIMRNAGRDSNNNSSGIVLDIDCSFIETTRFGNINGGTRVLDVVNADSHENTNLKYLKLETNVINSILINILDSTTKVHPVVFGNPYIVVHLRPRLFY